MAETTITEQIVREAKPIEEAKIELLKEAGRLYGQGLTLPAIEAAGLSATEQQAIDLAKQGQGIYAPYLQQGSQGITRGMGLGEAGAQGIAGLDIAGQFAPATATVSKAAGMMPQYMQADLARSQGTLGAAEQAAMAAGAPGQAAIQQGLGALSGAAQGFDPTQTQAFMNPYQQQVIDEVVRQINRQGDIARQGLAAQAVGAGAFGSTREGVQRAELERALSEQRNAAIVGGLSQGYTQAQQAAQNAFEAQQARQLQQAAQYGQLGTQASGLTLQQAAALQGIGGLYGQQALQQAQLGQSGASALGALGQGLGQLASTQSGLELQRGTNLANIGAQVGQMGVQQAALGEAAQRMNLADVNALTQLGGLERQNYQTQLDAIRATALQQEMAPYQQLAFVSDIYKGAPSTQMAMTSQSAPSASPFQQTVGTIAGTGAAIAGASKLF